MIRDSHLDRIMEWRGGEIKVKGYKMTHYTLNDHN